MSLYSRLGNSGRAILTGFFWFLYLAPYPFSYRVLGSGTTALSLLPISGTAWIFGARWGFLAALFSIPINMVFEFLTAGSINIELTPTRIIGTLITLVASLIIGRMSDTMKQVNEELQLRKEVEAALQERTTELQQQKQYFEALVQNSPIAIVSLALDQKIKSCNPSFEKLFGYTENEIIGKDLDQLIADDDHLDEATKISSIVQSGTPVQTSGKRRTKNGKIIEVDIYGVPVVIDGRQDGILGQYVDVTEKKLVETALQGQLHFLQTIIDVIPSPVSYKDAEGVYLGCNAAFIESIGKPREEIIGRSIKEVLPKRTADLFAKVHKGLLKNPGTRSFEAQVLFSDIYPHDIIVHKATFDDIHGNIAGTIGVWFDITDIKQAERELHESEARFRSIFEFAPDGVIILDSTGVILFWNPAAEKLFGYSSAEIIGKNVELFLPQSKHSEYQERLMRLHETGMSHLVGKTMEVEGKLKKGTTIPIDVSFSRWEVDDKRFISIIVRDATERKFIENKLKEAKTTAEEAARVKAEFLANMSHEIRTPLNAVTGMTGLLLNSPLTSEQLDFVETIRLSSDSLLNIINRILDFSKIEAGKLNLEAYPFNLRRCVETALDLVAPSAAEKELNLAYIIENSTPNILIGDGSRLQQILVNLLANAIKFTQDGEVVVAVCPKQISDNNYEIHFSVRDTGIGIPQDSINLLFQSFSQVDSSTKRKYGGTGLGLSISKHLVEGMGGEIHVESKRNEGSVFSFWITAEALPQTSPISPKGNQPELEKKRILIVDNHLTNLRILAQHTQSWGMQPHAFQSGEVVLNTLRDGEKFDVGILSPQLYNLDGTSLVKEIRKLYDSDELPLIMLKTMGSKDEKGFDDESLFTNFLTKPIKPAVLFDVLMNVFHKSTTAIQELTLPKQIENNLATKHPLRILLAEDNPVNQKVTVKILETLGYRPDVASNGFDVIHALERQAYDLILMDIQMPEMDGEQATRIIRNNFLQERQPHIVAMTAHALEGDREKYLDAGMDDYISKPAKIDELVKVLEKTPSLKALSISKQNDTEGS
jgi:PAS domain S-box-containing protein